ncbi:MAG: hypothetical protein R3246_11110 [Acidimicrobiia bacterium]|nr:hypothetical protein [Acidimicrobiia bacterium]
MLAMDANGLSAEEIGERINRSPEQTTRILEWARIPRSRPPASRAPRAVEQRVLDLRASGESHERIARRFNRSARSIRQIEGLAHFRLAMNLLEREDTSA